jgi:hypothetical protein
LLLIANYHHYKKRMSHGLLKLYYFQLIFVVKCQHNLRVYVLSEIQLYVVYLSYWSSSSYTDFRTIDALFRFLLVTQTLWNTQHNITWHHICITNNWVSIQINEIALHVLLHLNQYNLLAFTMSKSTIKVHYFTCKANL